MPVVMSLTYTFCPDIFACMVNCAASTVTGLLVDVPIDPLSLTSTTWPAGCDPVPAIPAPVPLVAIVPVVPVSSRKKISAAAVPTVEPLIVTVLAESLKYAESAAVAVRVAVLIAKGDVQFVPIVPVVSVTLILPAVTISPGAVNSDGALFAVRLYVPPEMLS